MKKGAKPLTRLSAAKFAAELKILPGRIFNCFYYNAAFLPRAA